MSEEYELLLPAVKVLDNAFDGCKDFIDEVLATDGWSEGRIGSGENDRVLKEIRNVNTLTLDRKLTSPVSWYLVSRGIMMHALEYAKEYGHGISEMEPPQVLHYSADPEHRQYYKPHVDTDYNGVHVRDFSAVLYLNTVEEGGDTVFSYFGVGVQPVEGRIVFFPANYAYMHEALPPISGDKFAVVTWFKFGPLQHDDNHSHDHGPVDMEFIES
jgi:hypothetical protein